MCLGNSGDPSGGIRKQQAHQQARINEGMQQLNAIFFGGTANPYSNARGSGAYDPNQQYYKVGKGGEFVPYQAPGAPHQPGWATFGPGQDQFNHNSLNIAAGGIPISNWLFNDKPTSPGTLLKQGKLYTKGAAQTYTGFTPEFFQKAQQNYLDYALPQLGEQARQTSRQLQYRIADQGIQGSSAATDLNKQFSNELTRQRQNISNQALGQSQQLQRDINQQYAQLVNQLQLSGNPSAVTQQALQTASTFGQPTAMAPVGNLFQNFANSYLAGQNYNMYNNYMNQYMNQYRPGGGFPTAPASRIIG